MTSHLLRGVRVLDLTNVLSGPFACYQLALMGAEVLKVEALPDGDLARKLGASQKLSKELMGISFLAQNSQKRSITVNLKTETGKEILRSLIKKHDVLVENFRPGVLERLGFSWDELRSINPGLVYCAISGFGQNGPLRERPAYDQIIQGMSGLMSVTGSEESAPLRVGPPISDTIGGFAAAFAVSSALVRREKTGIGAFLDVSMLEATLSAMGWVASDYLVGGTTPSPMGNENRTAAPSGTFTTADGKFNISANKQEQFEELCYALNRADLITDTRFAEREIRKTNREELRAEIESVLKQKPSAYWDEVLAARGIPGGPVLDVATALSAPQVRERGLVTSLPFTGTDDVGKPTDNTSDSINLLGSPIHVDGSAVQPTQQPPFLGQHTEEVLEDLGYTNHEIASLRAEGVV